MKKLLLLFFIILNISYALSVPKVEEVFPMHPNSGSPLMHNSEFVRVIHTLNISDDSNTYTFKSNTSLIIFTLFFATIIGGIGHKFIIFPITLIFRLDEDALSNKYTITFSVILAVFIVFSYMLPTITTFDFVDKKVSQKDFILPKGDDISFSDIQNLQIIEKEICIEDSDHDEECGDSYELNLLLTDYSRINITDHFKYSQIKEEATLLAERLNKPLFDYVDD